MSISPAKLFFALAASFGCAAFAHGQVLRVVIQSDSALVIAALPPCASPCTDSARVEWRYGSQYISRTVRNRTQDTLRVARLITNSAYLDSARLNYVLLGSARRPTNVATFVAPLPAVAAPVAIKPTSPPPTATNPVVAPATAAAPPTTSRAAESAPVSSASASTAPVVAPAPAGRHAEPIRPATVSVAYPALTGQSRRVPAGGNLQAALNAAQPGDEIVLANGAKFTGNYTLPVKQGTGWIVLRGEAKLPLAGTRIDATTLAGAAHLITPNSMPAVLTAPGAARWRLVGLQISHAAGAAYNYGIVVLGRGDERSVDAMPSDIVLDRMYVHGSTTDGNSRCIAFNGVRLAVVDSWITECHAKGFDAQGVCGWNGAGPFLIENNRIEASGEGVLFGGADPRVRDVGPSDITVRRNYIFKPLAWGRGRWTVKAAFELKNGKRVLFEGNVIENHWADGQTGFAILFQTLADNNRSWEWTTVQDVLVQNNVIKNSTSGVNILSRVAYNGGTLPTNPTTRVAVINNRFENVGLDPFKKMSGIAVQLLGDLRDVTFAKNTFTLSSGQLQKAISFDGKAQTRTTITDNVFPASSYGVTGNATGAGTATINAFMPGGVFRNNVIPGIGASIFPAGAITSSASGANDAAINAAIAGVVR